MQFCNSYDQMRLTGGPEFGHSFKRFQRKRSKPSGRMLGGPVRLIPTDNSRYSRAGWYVTGTAGSGYKMLQVRAGFPLQITVTDSWLLLLPTLA